MSAHAITAALVAAIALLLGYAGPALDDHSTERAIADDLQAAQHQQARTLRRDMAAARICREAHGEASFAWTHDGKLVCIPRRGHSIIAKVSP